MNVEINFTKISVNVVELREIKLYIIFFPRFCRYRNLVKFYCINVENLLNNSVGVGEHPDLMETIEGELEKMSSYHDKLEMLDYFDISINDKKILND